MFWSMFVLFGFSTDHASVADSPGLIEVRSASNLRIRAGGAARRWIAPEVASGLGGSCLIAWPEADDIHAIEIATTPAAVRITSLPGYESRNRFYIYSGLGARRCQALREITLL